MSMSTQGKLLNSITSMEFNTVRLHQQWIEKQGLSFEQMSIFQFLLYHENVTQKRLAEEGRLPKQTVHNWIKQLQKKGIVELKPSKEDRREKIIQFTPEGREYCIKAVKPITQISEIVYDKLGESFFTDLLENLTVYYRSFQMAMEIAELSAEWEQQLDRINEK